MQNIISANMIAPCGLDCGICKRALTGTNPCPGCHGPDENKPEFCAYRCGIILCEKRKKNGYEFCDECPDYPCEDVMEKQNRYTSKYPLYESPAKNLRDIRELGMEAFLPEITRALPDLPVIEASEGIELLEDGNAVEILEAEEEEGANSHIWLDPLRAVRMAENLAAGLCAVLPGDADTITANLDAYRSRLQALDTQLKEGLGDLPSRDIVTFHEAFPYFAAAYGLNVVAVVNKEPGEVLTPSQLGELVREIRSLGNPPLFVEPQYTDLSARTLSAETGAPVYSLDPVVTGPEENVPLDYYETAMLQNMNTLIEALSGSPD